MRVSPPDAHEWRSEAKGAVRREQEDQEELADHMCVSTRGERIGKDSSYGHSD